MSKYRHERRRGAHRFSRISRVSFNSRQTLHTLRRSEKVHENEGTAGNNHTEEEEKEKIDTDVGSGFSGLSKVSSDTDGPLKRDVHQGISTL